MISVRFVSNVVMLSQIHRLPIILAVVRVIANWFHRNALALPLHDMGIIPTVMVGLYHFKFIRSLLYIAEALQCHAKGGVFCTYETA